MAIKTSTPSEAIVADAPGFRRKDDSQVLTGRQDSIVPFTFGDIYADGKIYTPEEITSTYPTGIPGVLERVSDNGAFGSSDTAVPTPDKKVWKLICHPDHKVTFNRPRTQINGKFLKMRTNYRMHIAIRLNHVNDFGWNTKAVDLPYAVLFALSQQSGGVGYDFDAGQYSTGSSPLYITMKGSSLYIELRTIAEEAGLAADDAGGGNYTRWDVGDTIRTCRKITPMVSLSGLGYHEIILDFNLDERRIKDGGKGYFKATFDGLPWLDYYGATSLPRNAAGNLLPCRARLGFYEITGATSADGTLNKNVTSTNTVTIERSLLIHHYSVTRT